jgi:hypothetical protein
MKGIEIEGKSVSLKGLSLPVERSQELKPWKIGADTVKDLKHL